MKKRVGIWLRVSTEEQAQGDSPKHHEERARMFANFKEWEVVEVYHLEAVSGKSVIEHPEARRMLMDIRRGHIQALIFSKIARLARNTKELLEFSEIFNQCQADLVSIDENIDTSSPSGRFFYTILSAMAQWEREEIASRVKASVKVRAQMGKRVGGKIPYGYIWNGHSLEINEEEAVVRRLIFELFLESKRKKRVASILNERGYRTRGGKIFYDTNVKRWIRDPLSKGLRISHFTEKYDDGKKTRYKPKEEWVFNEAPAIVSEEIWQKANDILDEQETTRTKPLNRLTHLFTKFIYCGCGAKMNVRSGNKFYRCTDTSCNNKIVREDLEEIYKSQLTEFIVSPEDIDTYLMGSQNVIEERKQLLQSVQKKKEQLELDLKKIVDLHLQGHIPTEAFKEYHDAPYQQLQQVKNEITQLEGELLGMKNQQDTKDFIIKEARSIYGNWDNLGKEEKQSIIDAITEKIVIGTDDSIDIVLKQLLPESYSLKNAANGQHNLSARQRPYP